MLIPWLCMLFHVGPLLDLLLDTEVWDYMFFRKRRLVFNELHGVIFQKVDLFIPTAERTWNPDKNRKLLFRITYWMTFTKRALNGMVVSVCISVSPSTRNIYKPLIILYLDNIKICCWTSFWPLSAGTIATLIDIQMEFYKISVEELCLPNK
jgi:hypothetical protein